MVNTVTPIYSGMLYNKHLVIAVTFLNNRPNDGQTLEKPLYSGHFFGKNFPLNNGHTMIGWENRKHMHVFV